MELPSHESDYLIARDEPKPYGRWSKFAFIAGAIIAGSSLVALNSKTHFLSSSVDGNDATTPLLNNKKRVLKHSVVANKVGYDALPGHILNAYSAELIVEPDVEMVLTIPECTDNSCGDVKWEIVANEGPRVGTVTYDETSTSTSLSAIFTNANTQFTVTVSDLDGNVLTSTIGTVKYVRREIRSLTEKDRVAFFQALKTVFTVSTTDGQALYGDKFLGHAHLTALHNMKDEKYHNNLFFLTSHPVMQIKCDQSLIAVDPTVTLSYWDFTMDAHLGRDWAKSPIYQEDWFGPVATSKESNYRVTGTFHDVKLVYDKDESQFPKAYHGLAGYLAGSSSSLTSEHLQRSNQYCGFSSVQGQSECANVQICFDKFASSSNLREFDICMEHYVHANLHTMHSGQWDCSISWSDFYEEHEEWLDEMLLSILAVHASGISVDYISKGYVTCPSSCDAADGSEACSCYSSYDKVVTLDDVDSLTDVELFERCQDIYSAMAKGDLKGLEYIERQDKYMIGDHKYTNVFIPLDLKGKGKTGGAIDNIKLRALNVLLMKTTLFPGTFGIMTSGAAANDPLFWVMHQLFDKALHALRLSPRFNKNGFKWNNKDGYITWIGETPFTRLDFEPYLADHVKHQDPLKNKELWALLAPDSETVYYVYDQMTNWGGCEYDPFN
jgi:hypothetical protein